ncbi:MAG: DUF2806 domain-containing protein [Sphingomonadales bacterium]|nr:MAG: DUF2806 domain-containing protein [Sphingomonadales bacterium]
MSDPAKNSPPIGSSLVSIAAGLPTPIQTGFWKAAGRLVGGALATPAALLRRPAQAVEDKTDATSIVTRRIAEAVADRAASDPEILERAMQSLVREEFRKQSNKESVIVATAETLREKISDPSTIIDEEIEDDWMNVFVRYAEDASSERMQKLWGRVLAGEIRKPGKFSLSTIRFLSELDTRTAEFFEEVARCRIRDGIFFSKQRNSGPFFGKLLELESAGLLQVGAGMLSREYISDDRGVIFINGEKFGIRAFAPKGTKITIPFAFLTRLGLEICDLLPPADEEDEIKLISSHINADYSKDKKFTRAERGAMAREASKLIFRPIEKLWENSETDV